MPRHLAIALILFLLGCGAMLGAKFAYPWLVQLTQTHTSDAHATKGTIRVGVDNWVGYFPLCSPRLKRNLRRHGYLLECVDDQADLLGRFQALANRDLEFAVSTVDSNLLVGARFDFPGTVVAVIDESKGGDAIVAWEDKLRSLDDLKTMPNRRIAFTPDSPSHHLLRALSVDFDIPWLRSAGPWRLAADGSKGALEAFLKREVDAAVLWEPDVSAALSEKGAKKLLSTADTQGLIVDVLLVNRAYSREAPEAVKGLLSEYFRALQSYRSDSKSLVSDLQSTTKLSESQVRTMLNGVRWVSLSENAERWLSAPGSGSDADALVDTMEGTADILLEFGALSGNPIPNRDPYRLTHSAPLHELYRTMAQAPAQARSGGEFRSLSPAQWQALEPVGTLKVRPIVFSRGTAELTNAAREQLDTLAQSLQRYPNFRVSVDGHTGLRGDPESNRKLSEERAETVARYLRETHQLHPNRLHANGYGSHRPLPRLSGESNRAYGYRLPRVELRLLSEVL